MKRSEIVNKEVIAADARGIVTAAGGKPVACRLGTSTQLYLFHESEQNGEGTVTRAFVVEVSNPVTRAKAINQAEMLAYDLHDALQVASFNASLARKARNGEDLDEVREHDEFIAEVKAQLSDIIPDAL